MVTVISQPRSCKEGTTSELSLGESYFDSHMESFDISSSPVGCIEPSLAGYQSPKTPPISPISFLNSPHLTPHSPAYSPLLASTPTHVNHPESSSDQSSLNQQAQAEQPSHTDHPSSSPPQPTNQQSSVTPKVNRLLCVTCLFEDKFLSFLQCIENSLVWILYYW